MKTNRAGKGETLGLRQEIYRGSRPKKYGGGELHAYSSRVYSSVLGDQEDMKNSTYSVALVTVHLEPMIEDDKSHANPSLSRSPEISASMDDHRESGSASCGHT